MKYQQIQINLQQYNNLPSNIDGIRDDFEKLRNALSKFNEQSSEGKKSDLDAYLKKLELNPETDFGRQIYKVIAEDLFSYSQSSVLGVDNKIYKPTGNLTMDEISTAFYIITNQNCYTRPEIDEASNSLIKQLDEFREISATMYAQSSKEKPQRISNDDYPSLLSPTPNYLPNNTTKKSQIGI
jgi:hypothetical protein